MFIPSCVFPRASFMLKVLRRMCSSSIENQPAPLTGPNACGSTTCAPTRGGGGRILSLNPISTTLWAVIMLKIAISALKANASTLSATMNCSSAIKSVSTSSGYATKALKVLIPCHRPMCLQLSLVEDLQTALEQFMAISEDLGGEISVSSE